VPCLDPAGLGRELGIYMPQCNKMPRGAGAQHEQCHRACTNARKYLQGDEAARRHYQPVLCSEGNGPCYMQ